MRYFSLIIIFLFTFISCKKKEVSAIVPLPVYKAIDTFPKNAFWSPVSNFKDKVPVVYINTKGNKIVNEPKVQSIIQIQLGDTIVFKSNIGIEYRGSTSFRLFDQKSYGFELRDAFDEDTDSVIMDFPKQSDFILYAPANDKALIRNTLIYDLSGSNLSLSFDLAKAQYSATYNDRLKVDVSTDCGATYTNIYDKDGLDLSTLPGYNSTSSWAPNSGSDWRTETIDLSSYANQNVKIRFVSINDYSNSTYIDNIVVTGTLSTNRVDFDDHFTLFPNPVDDSFTVRSKQADIKKVVIYNLLGREVSTLKIDGIQQLVNINTTSLSSGVYLVRLESDLGVFHKKIVKK